MQFVQIEKQKLHLCTGHLLQVQTRALQPPLTVHKTTKF